MKRIIVPTDFSSGAWNALVYAKDLARTFNVDQLLVLNSYHEPHSGAATMLSIVDLMKEESQRELQELQSKIEEHGFNEVLNIEYKSIHTTLVGALNSQLGEPGQLIVMGTLGKTRPLEKLIGSNAFDVISKVDAPVLVVPPECKFSLNRKLLMAVDNEKLPQSIDLDILKTFSDNHENSKVEAVHVVKKEDDFDQEAFKNLMQDVPFESSALYGEDVTKTLDEYIADQPIDLLVVLRLKRSLLEKLFHISTTKKLALHAHIPLLVLKEHEVPAA